MRRQLSILFAFSIAQTFAQNPLQLELEANPIFTPNLTYSADYFKNVSGGLRTGTEGVGTVEFGFDLNLEELWGWQGTTFSVSALTAHGDDFSADIVGDLSVLSNIFADTDFSIFRVKLVKKFAHSGSFLKVGQLALDDSSFGPLNTQSANIAAPIFPLGAPGALFRYQANENLSITTAIYAGFAGDSGSGDNGFDWEFGGSAGFALFAEAAYRYGAGSLLLGGYHHTGDFEDYSNGNTDSGLSSFWIGIEHTLLKNEQDHEPSVNIFARASIVPQEERAVATSQIDGSVVAPNLFCKDDALGLACSYTTFGDDYLTGSSEAGITESETIIELTYALPLHKNFSIQPSLQYIVDAHFAGRDAFVVGARSQLTF